MTARLLNVRLTGVLGLPAVLTLLAFFLFLPTPCAAQDFAPARRGELLLDGVWRFQPAEGARAAQPAEADWGEIRVPGSWAMRAPDPGVLTTGDAWKDFHGDQTARGWYERTVAVPAAWAGRAIFLDLDRVSTDAVVSVNGRPFAPLGWPGGSLDITDAVTPGQTATIRVLVVATPDAGKVTVLMGTAFGQNVTRDASLASRGLIGDVSLESRPRGPHVADVFVKTSTRQKQVALDVALDGVTQAGSVRLIAHMLDEKGHEEKRFAATLPVQAAKTQTLHPVWPWPNPRLWDVGRPNLYTLRLEVTGPSLRDEYDQPFGFREFWIQGRRFFLNGAPFRLRPNTLVYSTDALAGPEIAAHIEGSLHAGFNIGESWPADTTERSSWDNREATAAAADRMGYPIMENPPSISPFWGAWDGAGQGDGYRTYMEADLRRLRNHPSIFLWSSTPNLFGGSLDPRKIGVYDALNNGYDPNDASSMKRGHGARDLIHAFDPTRPVMYHHGGAVGDIYSLNLYYDFVPLQEREEMITSYLKHGNMPFTVVEFGTPLDSSFMRGRTDYGNAMTSEPLMTEYASIYLGRRAYALETPEYRSEIARRYAGGMKYQSWQGAFRSYPAFQEVETLFNQNTWRSWRVQGNPGGMIPWDNGEGWADDHGSPAGDALVTLPPYVPGTPGLYWEQLPKRRLTFLMPPANTLLPAGVALTSANGPVLAFLAGAPDVTDKAHHFRPGETVRKQIALLNDTRSPQPFTARWSVRLGARLIAQGAVHGTLAVGETRLSPLAAPLPLRSPGPAVDGQIALAAEIGGRAQADTFSFRVYCPAAQTALVPVTVFDPQGKTTALLRSLDYRPVPSDLPGSLNPAPGNNFLVVGRTALSSGAVSPASLESFVQKGGRLLVMAQDPDWVRDHLGLRVSRQQSRRVFPLTPGDPAWPGVDAEDLRDWNGSSTLLDPYPHDTRALPPYFWRWGNRHVVTSGAFEKPHMTSWRPLFECEFDQAYTPLMEMDYGRGRITLCAFDFEDHAALDPAAARLARMVVERARTLPLVPKSASVVYVGGAGGRALLDEVGCRCTVAAGIPPGAALVIVGPDAALDTAKLRSYVSSGGRVLVMPSSASAGLFGETRAHRDAFGGSLAVPGWPEARGLSASDLHWKADAPADVLSAGPGVEVGADGLLGRLPLGRGEVVFSQIDPDRFDVDHKTYFRLTRWRQTRAFCQVLSNLGAGFAADSDVFRPPVLSQAALVLGGSWKGKLVTPVVSGGGLPDLNRLTDAARPMVAPEFDDSSWATVDLPRQNYALGGEWQGRFGESLFRKSFLLPPEWAGRDLTLHLGNIFNWDIDYVNGQEFARTDGTVPDSYAVDRVYTIPARLLRPGRNQITLRIVSPSKVGGLIARSAPDMRLEPVTALRQPVGMYHWDYINDFALGDDPARFYLW